MFFAFLIISLNCYIQESLVKESFTFLANSNRKITLSAPKINSIKALKKKDKSNGQWYYVHFLISNMSEIQKYIVIRAEDFLVKNTYILFLNQNQIEKIENISYFKQIDPNEKYFEGSLSIDKTDFLIISSAEKFELPLNDDYIIENKFINSFIIKINKNQLTEKQYIQKKNKVIDFLTKIPEIKTVSTYKNPIQANAFAAGFTQKNSIDFEIHPKKQFNYLDRYLNNKGITGKNQTITIVDSPIDFNHAMFRDDAVKFNVNEPMPNHRKISYYRFNGNLDDLKNTIELNEHGTHVAGTAAGNNNCPNGEEDGANYFNGIAPDSKIIYGGNFNYISDDVMNLMNDFNSRLFSNSWGVEAFNNDINYMFGELAESYPNYTILFASGNGYLNRGNFSINEPGSKNIVTVGSINDFYTDALVYKVTCENDPKISYNTIGYFDPWFVGTVSTNPGEADLLVVNLSEPLLSGELDQNDYFIVYGDDLSWFVNYINQKRHVDPLFVYFPNYDIVKLYLDAKSRIRISQDFTIDYTKQIQHSIFSSTGPANKGILKPDLVSPGYRIFSAKSFRHSSQSHGCNYNDKGPFTIMVGTSMSTPNVAGGAALIRQYFESGYWIDNITLDGDTTRALLINSCRHQGKSPDIIFGHGVVDLSTILPIEDDFGVQITYQEQNKKFKKQSIKEDGHLMAKLMINKTKTVKKLQITLSYIDKMLNQDSFIPITHDLDLIVVSPNKKIYFGDHLQNNDTQHTSTNEKIIIDEDELENGEYLIHVYGGIFAESGITNAKLTQNFAVVASGPIDNGYLEFVDSSECPCDKCDPNNPGYCLCKNDEIGQSCQIKLEKINGNEGEFVVGSLNVKRINFVTDKKIIGIISTSSNPGKDATIWASTKCHQTIGEYSTNGITNNKSSSAPQSIPINFGTKNICIAIFNNNDKDSMYKIELITEDDPSPSPTSEPTHSKSGKCGSSQNCLNDNSRTSSKTLGNFKIESIYVGSSTIINLQIGYKIMNKLRKILGPIIPPPNFVHSAIWVGSSDVNEDSLGAVFVYGKYFSNGNDSIYLSHDGARSFVMTLKEFKEFYDSSDVKKLITKRNINLFDFIEMVKTSGKWDAKEYNWPTNNCQHFTSTCLNILHAIRESPNENDWMNLPRDILKMLQENENIN